MRSFIWVKIFVFTLRSKNIEQGTRKEEGRKHWNNRTLEQFNNGMRRGKAKQDRDRLRPLPEDRFALRNMVRFDMDSYAAGRGLNVSTARQLF